MLHPAHLSEELRHRKLHSRISSSRYYRLQTAKFLVDVQGCGHARPGDQGAVETVIGIGCQGGRYAITGSGINRRRDQRQLESCYRK